MPHVPRIAWLCTLLGAAACSARPAPAPRTPAAAVDAPAVAQEVPRMTPPTSTATVPRTPSGAVMPAIDARAPAHVETATFAMG